MISAAIIVWFVCGISGVHLEITIDPELPHWWVWTALAGPLSLLCAVGDAVEIATRKADK